MKSFGIGEVLIYNPTLKSLKKKPIESDIQQAKIMAYFPPQAPIEQKCNTVGMAEGVYQFSKSLFSVNEQLEIANYQVTFLDSCCLVLKEVEENVWLFLKLVYSQEEELYRKQGEVDEVFSYFQNVMTEKIALKMLDHFYFSLWTFYGNLGGYLFNNNLSALQKILEYFVPTYESLNRLEQTKKLDISSYILCSIRAIPLDVNSHLKFGYFKNVMESYDHNVTDMIIFSHGLLAYTSMPKDITQFFSSYFFGTGEPYKFDINFFLRKFRIVEELAFINPEEKYGTMFNSIKFGLGDFPESDNRGSISTSMMKARKSQDLLGIEEGEKLAFPIVYIKKNGEEHKLYLSCFFEKKMLFLTFFNNITKTDQIIFQNKFYHDNTDKFTGKIAEIYNNLLTQNDIYKFLYSNLSTGMGKSTVEKWNVFSPQLRYVWDSLEENTEGAVATTFQNHWLYGFHRFNRLLVLMIPGEVPLHKLEQYTDKMTKEYFFKAFM